MLVSQTAHLKKATKGRQRAEKGRILWGFCEVSILALKTGIGGDMHKLLALRVGSS